MLQMSVNFLVSLLKKNWQNVRSLHCKTTMVSAALPSDYCVGLVCTGGLGILQGIATSLSAVGVLVS